MAVKKNRVPLGHGVLGGREKWEDGPASVLEGVCREPGGLVRVKG